MTDCMRMRVSGRSRRNVTRMVSTLRTMCSADLRQARSFVPIRRITDPGAGLHHVAEPGDHVIGGVAAHAEVQHVFVGPVVPVAALGQAVADERVAPNSDMPPSSPSRRANRQRIADAVRSGPSCARPSSSR